MLAAAVSAAVEYLVTGDGQLQRLGAYQGVTILSPRDFLTVLEEHDVQIEQEDGQSKEEEQEDEKCEIEEHQEEQEEEA